MAFLIKNSKSDCPAAMAKTAEVCLEAIGKNGLALEFVPDALKTKELCLEAVKQDIEALKYVPEKLKTPELCFDAVKRSAGRCSGYRRR